MALFTLRKVFYIGVVILFRLSPFFLCVYSKREANNTQIIKFEEYTQFLLSKSCDFPPKATYQQDPELVDISTPRPSPTSNSSHEDGHNKKPYEYGLSSLLVCSKHSNTLCLKFINLSKELCTQRDENNLQAVKVLEKLKPEKLHALIIENSTWNACDIIMGNNYVADRLPQLAKNRTRCTSVCVSNDSDIYYVCNFMVAALLAQWEVQSMLSQSETSPAPNSTEHFTTIKLTTTTTTAVLKASKTITDEQKDKNEEPSSDVKTNVTLVTKPSETGDEKGNETKQPSSTVTTTLKTVNYTYKKHPKITTSSTAKKTATDPTTMMPAEPTLVSAASTKETVKADILPTSPDQDNGPNVADDTDDADDMGGTESTAGADDSGVLKEKSDKELEMEDGIQSSGGSNDKERIDREDGESRGHFMAYFITAAVLCISGYVLYHNRQKILAFVLEGRRKAGQRRRTAGSSSTSNSAKYSKLESAVDDVMPSFDKSLTTKNYIY